MEKEKIDKKEHILDVAERLFSELSYDGASNRVISREAGLNRAMLNYYFGWKDGLFTAVFERRVAAFRAIFQNINQEKSALGKCSKGVWIFIYRLTTLIHTVKIAKISAVKDTVMVLYSLPRRRKFIDYSASENQS